MKSIYYIRTIIGLAFLGLSACTDAPIAKTNCWAAGSQTTGASAGTVSRAAVSPNSLGTESDNAPNCQ